MDEAEAAASAAMAHAVLLEAQSRVAQRFEALRQSDNQVENVPDRASPQPPNPPAEAGIGGRRKVRKRHSRVSFEFPTAEPEAEPTAAETQPEQQQQQIESKTGKKKKRKRKPQKGDGWSGDCQTSSGADPPQPDPEAHEGERAPHAAIDEPVDNRTPDGQTNEDLNALQTEARNRVNDALERKEQLQVPDLQPELDEDTAEQAATCETALLSISQPAEQVEDKLIDEEGKVKKEENSNESQHRSEEEARNGPNECDKGDETADDSRISNDFLEQEEAEVRRDDADEASCGEFDSNDGAGSERNVVEEEATDETKATEAHQAADDKRPEEKADDDETAVRSPTKRVDSELNIPEAGGRPPAGKNRSLKYEELKRRLESLAAAEEAAASSAASDEANETEETPDWLQQSSRRRRGNGAAAANGQTVAHQQPVREQVQRSSKYQQQGQLSRSSDEDVAAHPAGELQLERLQSDEVAKATMLRIDAESAEDLLQAGRGGVGEINEGGGRSFCCCFRACFTRNAVCPTDNESV